ncbi:hypothetical protein R1202_RS21420 [Escherichia coli]|nr:hypothetical protein [Escherichia coli]
MIEQPQSDFLFWIFIYFLIVGLLIRNIHLTRKIKSIEKNKMFPAEEYAVLDIEQHMSNKYIGRLVTRFMKRTNGAPLLIVFPEYDKGDNNEDKNSPPFQLVKLTSNINNIKEIYSNDDLNCFLNNISAQKILYTTHSGPSQAWIEHAYPLQQVTILLQGTRHSEREDIISQLEIILSRLKNGENTGFEHDDDFGYSFQYDAAAVGKSSFFDEAAGRK